MVSGLHSIFLGAPRLLAAFSWRGFIAFLACMVALSAWAWSGMLLAPKTISLYEHVMYFLELLQRNLLTYAPAYVLVSIADGFSLRGAARQAALAGALVAGMLLAVQARCAVMPDQIYWVYGSITSHYCAAFPTWSTYFDFPASYLTPLATASLAMVFVFGRRRDNELAAALHGARAAQLVSHRERLESDLEAMQSRVDPDVLFKTLADIRARYEDSAAEGDAMLDALIQRLREAARRPSAEAAA